MFTRLTTLFSLISFFIVNITTGQVSTMAVGDGNTYSGTHAGNSNGGSYNTSYGYQAGENLGPASTYNTLVGVSSGRQLTSGTYNTYVGMAGNGSTTGSYNVSVGHHSGINLAAGNNNTLLGTYAGYMVTGSNNVFIGYRAGYNESGSSKLYIDNSDTSSPLIYGDFATDRVAVNGVLSIGTPLVPTGGFKLAKDAKLSVGGTAFAEEMIVELKDQWPDFVFEENYKLPSFSEVEKYIREHKHLPGVPTAAEVKEQGINLGEMNVILLQKVEELTLELIRLEKRVMELEEKDKK